MTPPQKAQSSGGAAYTALMASLRGGTFRPGDRLREEEVAERLNLSRTPVREALRRMESEGIIEHRPRLGAIIRQLSQAEVVELYEMRIVLERSAAQMAAQHGSDAEFDTLDALNAEIAQCRDAPTLGAAINQDFHQGLYHAARNRFLLQSARALSNALRLLGATPYTDPARIDIVGQEHGDLVTQVRQRDAEAAGRAAERHLQTSLRHRLRQRTS